MVGVIRRAREQHGGVRLTGVSDRIILKLFEITRLNQAIPIDASDEEAQFSIALPQSPVGP